MFAKEKFVEKTLTLIEKEREAEIEETRLLQENVSPKELQQRGICVLKLHICSRHTGLYGRTVLVFEQAVPGKDMPSHKITPGDIAAVAPTQGDSSEDVIASGIVSRVTSSSISVAFEDSPEELESDDRAQYRLVKLANDVTYRRLKKALQSLNSYRTGPSGQLISVLFGDSEPGPPFSQARDGSVPDVQFHNEGLDASQREAVRFALHQREVAIIHGPPGTGKTTTVVEIILQAVSHKLKVLACAPSNIAVDNLVERLAGYKAKVVRLGHPARLLPTIQRFSLDALLSGSDEKQLVRDVRSDIDKSLVKMKKTRDKGERQRLREDLKHLRKELRKREEAATREILKNSQVVLATLTTATDEGPLKILDEEHFDLVIIDECSQALEVACWIALLRGGRCVLAGDHNQLPPTIISHKAAKEGLALTLMERLLRHHGDAVMRMLTVQYRMHEAIMEWPSKRLYDGRLTAHDSVKRHLLRDLPGVEDTEDTSVPLLLIDTAGCDLHELNVPDEVSKGNEGEADLVAHHVEQLVESGLAPENIAIIAPYNLQVELLRVRTSQKYPKLEIKSVDGFQGREKEAVIISLVRSNDKGEVGFLAEDRRINVAITRARRHLAVVCDSETVGRHEFLKDLVAYMTENGEVRSAQQYINVGGLQQNYARPDFLETKMQQKSTQKPSDKTAASKTVKPRAAKTEKAVSVKQSNTGSRPTIQTDTSLRQGQDYPQNSESTEMTAEDVEADLRDLVGKKRTKVTAFTFPTTLTSKERRLVHEVAERFGLLHISRGEGAERYIEVSRPPLPQANSLGQSNAATKVKDAAMSGPPPEVKQSLRKDGAPALSLVNVCDICGKLVPRDNFSLHTIRCKKTQATVEAVSDTAVKSGSKVNKKKKTKGDKTTAAANNEEEDFDSLIAQAMKDNRSCHVARCKNNAATLGQNCLFCSRRFCLAHFIAEAHGCGDRAKQEARATISREGVLHRGSGVPDKKPDPTRRAHLERRLDKKLTELTDNRKTKKKEK